VVQHDGVTSLGMHQAAGLILSCSVAHLTTHNTRQAEYSALVNAAINGFTTVCHAAAPWRSCSSSGEPCPHLHTGVVPLLHCWGCLAGSRWSQLGPASRAGSRQSGQLCSRQQGVWGL